MNRKQFISFEHISTNKATVTRGVTQGSILGPVLLLSQKAENLVTFTEEIFNRKLFCVVYFM